MKTGRILSAAFCAGRKHDFQLFKESEIELPPHVLLLADAGYQRVAGIHPNSLTPIKKTKLYLLDKEQKANKGRYLENASRLSIFFVNSKCFAFCASDQEKTFRSSFQFDRSRL
jgi:hypothetical protein